jgi:hypothetical protein
MASRRLRRNITLFIARFTRVGRRRVRRPCEGMYMDREGKEGGSIGWVDRA